MDLNVSAPMRGTTPHTRRAPVYREGKRKGMEEEGMVCLASHKSSLGRAHAIPAPSGSPMRCEEVDDASAA